MKQIPLIKRILRLSKELGVNPDSIYRMGDINSEGVLVGSYMMYSSDNERWVDVILLTGVTYRYCITGKYDVMCTVYKMSIEMQSDIICQVLGISIDKLNEFIRVATLITGGDKNDQKRRISKQERRTRNSR